MTSCKRKRTDLSLSQKLEIVQLASEKVSQTHLAQKFGCSQSTISKIPCQKDEIRQDAAENKVKDRKRKRGGKADDVEKALYTWFTDARSRDAPITTAILEEKARQFATALDKPNFHVTTGWLCRWKARHGIKYKRAHGEKNDADVESADDAGYVQSRIMEYPGYCHNMRVDRGYDIKRDLLYCNPRCACAPRVNYLQ